MSQPASPPGILAARDREYYFEEGCFIWEIINTPQDPAVSVARARLPPGATTRWHRLQGLEERYLVLQGEGLAEIGLEAPRRLASGDTLSIPAGCRQRIRNCGGEDLIFLAICTPRFEPAAYQDLEPPETAG